MSKQFRVEHQARLHRQISLLCPCVRTTTLRRAHTHVLTSVRDYYSFANSHIIFLANMISDHGKLIDCTHRWNKCEQLIHVLALKLLQHTSS